MTITGNLPTATAHQIRCQVFQPTRRPGYQNKSIATSWGTANVEGRLGQTHADTIEAMMYHAEKSRITEGGRLQILVDPHKVRMSVGGGKQYSYSQIWKVLLKDLKKAVVEVHNPKMGIKAMGSIIDEVVESPAERVNPLTGKQRHLWRVTLGPAWTQLIQEDLALYYDPMPIARLSNGVSQAVARHVLTHRREPQGGWKLEELLHSVGAAGRTRDRRNELIEDAVDLAKLGIEINGDRVNRIEKRDQLPGVRDQLPGNATSCPAVPVLSV